MDTKSAELTRLRNEILASVIDPWVFPEHKGVKGFLGAGPVMLVGERPSTGTFGGPSDRLLYSLLERHVLGEAHLTDVIKSRGKANDPYPADMSAHRRIFYRELEIVQPSLVITFGQKVFDLLQFTLADSGITIRRVWHYSYARRGAAKAGAFEGQLAEALRL